MNLTESSQCLVYGHINRDTYIDTTLTKCMFLYFYIVLLHVHAYYLAHWYYMQTIALQGLPHGREIPYDVIAVTNHGCMSLTSIATI